MNEVKVYAMNKATPEIHSVYNPDFIKPAVAKDDYDSKCAEVEDWKN